MTTIQEIHNSFETSIDLDYLKLLDKPIIDKELIQKVEKLKSLGFTNSIECKQLEEQLKLIENIDEENNYRATTKEAFEYYSTKYPNNVFMTVENVKSLVKKYDLELSTPEKYIGDIPDKNLNEILNFKLDDCEVVYKHDKYYSHQKLLDLKYKIKQEEYGFSTYNQYTGLNRFIRQDIEIIATKNLFNKNIPSKFVDDPIVLQKCWFKDYVYYLIISKWGNESSIDNLNYKNN
jgi:hypothetical protein